MLRALYGTGSLANWSTTLFYMVLSLERYSWTLVKETDTFFRSRIPSTKKWVDNSYFNDHIIDDSLTKIPCSEKWVANSVFRDSSIGQRQNLAFILEYYLMVWMFLVSKTLQWGSNENQSIEGNGEADKGVERQSCFNETMTCYDVLTPLFLVAKK